MGWEETCPYCGRSMGGYVKHECERSPMVQSLEDRLKRVSEDKRRLEGLYDAYLKKVAEQDREIDRLREWFEYIVDEFGVTNPAIAAALIALHTKKARPS